MGIWVLENMMEGPEEREDNTRRKKFREQQAFFFLVYSLSFAPHNLNTWKSLKHFWVLLFIIILVISETITRAAISSIVQSEPWSLMAAKIRDRFKNGEGSVFQRSTYFMFGFQIIYTFQSERKETSYVNVKLDQSFLIINIQLHYASEEMS